MELMEFLSLIHLPMPIMGSMLFLLGLVLIRLARQAAERPHPPAWLRRDMASLIVATVLSLPLSFGLGFLLAAVMQAARVAVRPAGGDRRGLCRLARSRPRQT